MANTSRDYDFYGGRLFVEREHSLLGYSRPLQVSTDIETPADEVRSKKKQDTLKTLEERVKQYTYRV